ncbi:sensor histidine kinase [Vibrio fluvialis]|uniref:sensor histidine kinase n=1 Tax=Vibrio fluvialis TaxID=676 RepID=UPI001F309A84|nr:ATP-binding protein [Vibrio fluvialis]MCE7657295.1 ATP-binding protein [Vibrio fluvialis]
MSEANKHPFKANAHLLKLLGDQLIGDDRLAIFELVKNAYDADAEFVEVTVDLEADVPNIVVWDKKGDGMCIETVKNRWLEIGTPSKRGTNRTRTKKGRMPLGEKGVGRLAVHKLGSNLIINTKSKNAKEVKIEIDWPKLLSDVTYINEAKVSVIELDSPEHFTGGETGTRIEISSLHNTLWERRDVRKLKRLITSLRSPFEPVNDFDISLDIKGRNKEMADMLDVEDVLERAIWTFDFELSEKGNFSYNYKFNPPELFQLERRELSGENQLELIPLDSEQKKLRKKEDREKFLITADDLQGIGAISGKFYVYTGNKKVLNAQGTHQSIRGYLSEQSGVRVYRDGIRVFNYGEPNDDWLGLNARRINTPGEKVSVNNVIAAIGLDLEKSFKLHEKTNREGFDENVTYQLFHHIVLSALEQFEIIHLEDRINLEEAAKSGKVEREPYGTFDENIEIIKSVIDEHGLKKELSGKIERIEQEFNQMRDVTATAGLAGMNLSMVFHEVEKGVDQLTADIHRNAKYEDLKRRADQLSKILEGITPLLKRNEHKQFRMSELVRDYFQTAEFRFEMHDIISSAPILTGETPDFEIKGPYGLIRGMLNNIVDNAIHWTKLKREQEGDGYKPAIRVLSLLDWFDEGPALVILDNGPGLTLPVELAVQPFKSKRPNGMGLGLYYVDLIMTSLRGRLLITNAEQLELDGAFSGVAVVLVFNDKALRK